MNDSISPILLSGGFSLHPYTQLEAEQFAVPDAQTFDAFTTEDIRMFLPGLPIFSGTSAEKYFSILPQKDIMGAGKAFAIRFNSGFVGMIILDSPIYNSYSLGLDVWSIDFFILEPFRGRKVIMESLYRMLELSKKHLQIDKLYASVDKRNAKCIHVLERFYFEHIQDDPTGKGALYMCDLNLLKFK